MHRIARVERPSALQQTQARESPGEFDELERGWVSIRMSATERHVAAAESRSAARAISALCSSSSIAAIALHSHAAVNGMLTATADYPVTLDVWQQPLQPRGRPQLGRSSPSATSFRELYLPGGARRCASHSSSSSGRPASLHSSLWAPGRGYPRCCEVDEVRLTAATRRQFWVRWGGPRISDPDLASTG